MSNGNGHHWSKFVWRDWSGDLALRTCSLGAKGFWMEMLCMMHEGTPVGYLTMGGNAPNVRQIAAYAACPEREAKKYLDELEAVGVFSRTDDGVIYCRRMVREAEADAASREAWKAHGSNGGNPAIIRGTVGKVERQRPYRRSDSPLKTERIFQRAGGTCHWCGVQLIRDNPTHPHFFHVDHVIAVRDGGGVEEANLVAACQACNMKRARHEGGTSDNNPPPNPTARVGSVRQEPKLESKVEEERLSSFSLKQDSVSPPAREGEPSEAAVRAARRQSAAEVAAAPEAIRVAIQAAAGHLRNYSLDGQAPRQTINEQREDVAARTPIKPAYLSREQLQEARRRQLKVVA